MNHFEILGLATQFELDVSSLSIKYRELQRQYHPDKFATASDDEQLAVLQKSSQINDAYQCLIDPIRRAEHLLFLHGFEQNAETQNIKDTEFLIEQMQLRENLEDIETAKDESALFDFSEKVETLYKERLAELTNLLNSNSWQQAAISVRKLKFLAKLKQEVERIEESFF